MSGLSKAYGLPGLRIGWLVAPPPLTADAWARHDYTTIGPSGPSDHLATLALTPGVREKIIARTRRILNENYPVLEAWLKGFGDTFTWTPPDAGAICYVKYRQSIPGMDVVERLRAGNDVLLVPGEHFGMPGHIRFGFGNAQPELQGVQSLMRVNTPQIYVHVDREKVKSLGVPLSEVFQTLQPRDKVDGAGLGLALVKKNVEGRGGRAWLESSAEGGATFYFLWPKEPDDEG